VGTNISADLTIVSRRYLHYDVVRLVADVQAEYVLRYGGPDETPVDPAHFDPPQGLFLVGYVDGKAVATGAWRVKDTDVAEIKRMYVAQAARRRGIAQLILADLESTAAAAGHREIWLETGSAQPEAIALYHRSGYTPIAPFGHYADAEQSVHLGKLL
jgi:GNAT superfamily N-acetyltransferase